MRILLADDDRDLAAALALLVEGCGHEVTVVTSGGLDVLETYGRVKPDVVIMDIMMPRFNGLTISHAIRGRNPEAKLVLMSGHLTVGHPFVASSGANKFLAKPIQFEELKKMLEQLEVEVGLAV